MKKTMIRILKSIAIQIAAFSIICGMVAIAVSFPTATPAGQTAGGKFQDNFNKIFGAITFNSGKASTTTPTMSGHIATKGYVDNLPIDASKISTGTINKARLDKAPMPNSGDNSDKIATTAWVKANTASATTGGITFSNCSITDKSQAFLECPTTCTTIGAYCGGGKVAGFAGGSLVISSLSDEGNSNWDHAFEQCWNKKTFGFDGWSLPNHSELLAMYNSRVATGNFASAYYWSSREGSSYGAHVLSFFNGIQDYYFDQTMTNSVRCIRKF